MQRMFFKKFNNNNLSYYHDLYVQSDTLLLPDIFTNFRKVYFDMYELDPAQLKKCPPPSPAVLWFVNGRERKPR